MKTASLPSLRVDPELRQAAERVLREGETLSQLIEASVREAIERRSEPSAGAANGSSQAEAPRPDLRTLLAARRKRAAG